MDTFLKIRMAPPLGLYTIANMIRAQHSVNIVNENIEKLTYDDAPDLVGITVTVDALPRAIEIANEYKKKGIPVIAGGIHISTAPETIPLDSFDSIGIGMAEGYWEQVMLDLKNGSLRPRYTCATTLKGSEIVSPAYDLINKDKYLYCNVIHTSRGCPFKCEFCYNSSPYRSYLNRPISDVLKDIQNVHSKHILFIDDNFIGNPAWTRAFLEAIKPMQIKWNAAVSANIADMPDLLDEMRNSGCQGLFIGFESINPSSLENVCKVQNRVEKYDRLIEAVHSRGIMINASLVFGLDSDRPETFRETLDWIVSHKIETVTSHILTPYPGTELHRKMSKNDRLKIFNLQRYNTAHVVFYPKQMSEKELYEGYLWIYRNIYSWKNIIKRMPRSGRSLLPYFLFNLLYRKYGRFTDALCKLISYRRIGYYSEKLSRYL